MSTRSCELFMNKRTWNSTTTTEPTQTKDKAKEGQENDTERTYPTKLSSRTEGSRTERGSETTSHDSRRATS